MAGIEVLKYSTIQDDQQEVETFDDEVDQWFLMSSPYTIGLIVAAYLYFVISLGPKYMEKRKPFDLKHILVVYNLYQVIFSSWVASSLLANVGAMKHLYNHICEPFDRTKNPYIGLMNTMAWWFFFSKFVELLDTVFFVLRKKQNQVSVLHVYHHANMLVSTWGYLKYIRGEQAVIPGVINSFVHIIMYSYYLLAALGPSVQKYLWWKKYITRLQLGQFVVIIIYLSGLLAFDCKLPRSLTIYMGVNTIVFLLMFLNFYHQNYRKKAIKKAD